jgi:fructooligosaccharide transport system substrate-binding protein
MDPYTRRHLLRQAAVGGGLIVLPGVLAACGADEEASTTAAAQAVDRSKVKGASLTSLRQDDGQGPAQRAFSKLLVDPWAKDRGAEAMTFRLVPYDELDRSIRQATGLDLADADGPHIPTYASTDVIQSVTSQFSSEDLEDFLPPVLAESEIGDDVYGVSLARSSQALLYDREVLARYDIKPPSELSEAWTWPEALEVFRQVTEGERKRRGTDQYWALQIANFGRPVGQYNVGGIICRSNGEKGSPTFMGVSEDGLVASGYIDTPESVEGLQFIQDLYQRYDVVPAALSPDLFVSGRTAFFWTFPFTALELDPNDYGVMPVPYFKTPLISTQAFIWAVMADAPNPDAAIDWVGWLSQPEQIRKGAEYYGSMPSRRSVFDQMPELYEGNMRIFTESVLEWGSGAPRTAGFSDYANIYDTLLADVAAGADPGETASGAAEDLDRLLARYPSLPPVG